MSRRSARSRSWPACLVAAIVVPCLLAAAPSKPEQRAQATASRLEPLPRDLELQLALSALPPHLRDQATVYVLDPAKGFEVARRGTNGFHAFVARTGDDSFRGTWPLTYRDDIIYPISFDDAGSKANMRVFFDAAAARAGGMAAQKLKVLIKRRYAAGYYKVPGRPGISYMMSPILRTYVDPENTDQIETTNNPHIMHYMPNVTNADIGGAKPAPDELRHFVDHGTWVHNPDPFVITQGPHGYLIQHLGIGERDAIDIKYAVMLERLCKLRPAWCLRR